MSARCHQVHDALPPTPPKAPHILDPPPSLAPTPTHPNMHPVPPGRLPVAKQSHEHLYSPTALHWSLHHCNPLCITAPDPVVIPAQVPAVTTQGGSSRGLKTHMCPGPCRHHIMQCGPGMALMPSLCPVAGMPCIMMQDGLQPHA